MNKLLLLIFPVFFAAAISIYFISSDQDTKVYTAVQLVKQTENEEDCNELYLSTMPQKESLSQNELINTWKEILSRPTENELEPLPVNSWKCIGPYGMRVGTESDYYSGRVLGIEAEGVPSTRIGTGSGGLWRYELFFPIPMTESATSQVIGAFATNPANSNEVIMGTGEAPNGSGGYGTGLYKTTDNGASWVSKTLVPTPQYFYKIKYYSASGGIVNAASNTGYFRSDNGGESWVNRMSGNVTDVEFAMSQPTLMYAAKWGDGLYKSINGGTSWFLLTGFPVTAASFGRASISVSESNYNYIYAAVANPAGSTVGIFRSTNQGSTWIDVSYRNSSGVVIDYHSNGIGHQGGYNNCIAVSPVNPNIVLAGGVSLIRTTSGGTNNWADVPGVHADHHIIRWHSDGIRIWEGNDGGLSYSDDYGASFTTNANLLPITQFYDFDIGVAGTNMTIAGGTQDNAFPVSTNCTINSSGQWYKQLGGDAGPSKVDKFNPQRIIGICGCGAGSVNRTTDGGSTWLPASSGLTNGPVFSNNIEDDGTSPVYCYIGNGNKIFSSTNFGSSWSQYTTYVFPSTVWRLNMSKFGPGGNIIYAVVSGGLRVYDSGTWYDRGAGLPADLSYVAQHPSDNTIAYALAYQNSSPQKVSITLNRGINWTNITGDLPSGVEVNDLKVNPVNNNILFIGTKYGMWKTTNRGVNWFRWTNGMPIANQIVKLRMIDSTSSTGRFYIVAASHGRSVWIREGSGDDPIGIHNQNTNIPDKFELLQNYPNPFNPSTKIGFSLPQNVFVELKVYDITGREQAVIMNSQMRPGYHEIEFDGTNLASGVYFYSIKAGDFRAVKKMILVK